MRHRILVPAALLVCSLPTSAEIASPWQTKPEASVRLIAEPEGVQPRGPLPLGLEFKLKKGWHVYWVNAGSAGYPPELTWIKTEGLRSSPELLYPAPHRIDLPGGLYAFGYEDSVVYPLKAIAEANRFSLSARVNYLVCEIACIPYTETVTLVGTVSDRREADSLKSRPKTRMTEWLAKVPRPLPASEVAILASGDPTGVKAALPRFMLTDQSELFWRTHPDFDVVSHSLTSNPLTASLTLESRTTERVSAQVPFTLVVTAVKNGERTESISFEVPINADSSIGIAALLLIILSAFLGGLILNAMPCVLPVLSLKILSLLKQTEFRAGDVRRSALATIAGILSMFLVLGFATIGAKSAGFTVGWGVQFQDPRFVFFLALIVLLFAMNLWGWFEIELPPGLLNRLARARSKAGRGLFGDFVSGVFATILATPCSAPFLGIAISAALVASAPVILTVFFTIGIGLAVPYFLLLALPRLVRFLPKPGAWMNSLKIGLGFLMLTALIWLLFVLRSQMDPFSVVLLELLLLLIAFLVWLLTQSRDGRVRVASLALVGCTAISAFQIVSAPPAHDLNWFALDPEKIAEHVREGKTVFVDVTADWCLTCKTNAALVLSTEAFRSLVQEHSIVLMRGDWTNRNSEIARFLATHGRYAIPFNAVFGPAAPSGILLTEILTTSIVKESVDRAIGKVGVHSSK